MTNYRLMSAETVPCHRSIEGAPVLMNKQQVADWLGVCVKTIDNWLLEGWLPVIQPSPRIQRFNPTRILATMEELFGRGNGYEEGNDSSATIHALKSR